MGLGVGAGEAGGQVVVNEFMAANTEARADVVDFEDYPDWIELRNTTAAEVSLDGFYLSDDPSKPYKWPFPAGATIPANGHFLVWADGFDAGPGEVHPRGYWPWRDFTTEGHHANFGLSADGESVVLTRAAGVTRRTLIQPADPPPEDSGGVAVWKYKDDGSDQSTRWRARTFDDGGWASGPAKLGYGNDGEATTVSYGEDSTNKFITTYFRHTFQVADPQAVDSLILSLVVDDGAVVYLNGGEVVRRNMEAGEIRHTTPATTGLGGAAEDAIHTYHLPASGLVAGDNVIAVEVHQEDQGSSDIGFDLGLEAEAVVGAVTLDSVDYGVQVDDISQGRDPLAGDGWVYFAAPTPGAANGGEVVADLTQTSGKVEFSVAGGFHAEAQTVALGAAAGVIRYTLDGSPPRADSAEYAGPLEIAATTTLRARVFEPGKVPGGVGTMTYFINEERGPLPVVSLAADPETLFGDRIGIYENQHEPFVSGNSGPRDVYKGKDAPASMEFFEADGAPGFQVRGGLRIGGENNWVRAQKALNLTIRGKYGDGAVDYDLFPGTGVVHHESLVLRNGGDNWARAMLRDAMLPALVEGQLKLDAPAYRPAVVYINGDYWGIHNLRSRSDNLWFQQKHHVEAGTLDYLGYAHHTSSSVSLGAFEGNTGDWLDLLAFLDANDLTDPAVWAVVESRIDLDNFIDFVAVETYVINTSWRHNREFWRARKPGAKWSWFVPDIDRGLNTANIGASGELDEMIAEDPVLERLMTRPQFVSRLAQRMMAHRASTFEPERVKSIVSAMDAEVAGEIPRHVARWAAQGGMSESGRADEIQEIKDFADQRRETLVDELRTQLGLAAPVEVTLALEGPGRVLIEGVPVEAGVIELFPGNAVALEAEAAPGFEFAGWTGVSGGAATEAVFDGASAVTARFTASGEVVVAGEVNADTTLAGGAVHTVDGDLVVAPGVTLTLAAGSELRMPAGANLRVMGALNVTGTPEAPVLIRARDGEPWGGISFENPDLPSTLSHLTIRGASQGHDPLNHPSAISALNAVLVMDGLDIAESAGPVTGVGGSTTLLNSRLHTPFTGDGLHVVRGVGEVRGCVFMGNNAPDTDAIDFDGVTAGTIAGNRIYRFQGPNSDGIDIGEQCHDVRIEGNLIYFNSDKGISVGQGSTVIVRRNLIVGCVLGIGIKDSGSSVLIDQNTYVDNQTGVAVYEKNFGSGGGAATIENSIFSGSPEPVTIDAKSSGSIRHSLSDTVPLGGLDNLLADPGFVDPGGLNFQLLAVSPAIDAGDPAHENDPDGSRADIGARYVFSADDYPFTIGDTVVVEELLANSEAGGADWIELHNRASSAIDIGGWFLSDSGSDLRKYRVPAGSVIPAGGYLVFSEDLNFGAESLDPGRITGFALSDTGETVYLSSALDDELTDYRTSEDFGPSLPGETLGNHYKPSSDSWNFVAQRAAAPGGPNAGPRIGPVVISEIMHDPAGAGGAEFFELLNVSVDPVSLYDAERGAAWRITDGVEHEFPEVSPVVMAPGERIILTRSLTDFTATFSVPPGTRVFEWTSGRLADEGESLQLGRPAGLDGANVRRFARVDRVNYDVSSPWPAGASGSGPGLSRIFESEYGNDFVNWRVAAASAGGGTAGESFADWMAGSAVDPAMRGEDDDPDGDAVGSLVEFAIGRNPALRDSGPVFERVQGDWGTDLVFGVSTERPGWVVGIEGSPTMAAGSWQPVESVPISLSGAQQMRMARIPDGGLKQQFYRMVVSRADP